MNQKQTPGSYIRKEIMEPRKITATEMANVLGVGRPALSNFLNGNAALSQDMAARIERAFGIPAQKLFDLQTAFDLNGLKGAPANTKTYVPPFLNIKANDIIQWSNYNISARSRLSVFLRTLVNSTGVDLNKVDFPGNDDAERSGWDGFVSAKQGTPWVPEGNSGWEFGCNDEPLKKADKDYKKSVNAISSELREEITFIFVSPKRWHGKQSWEKQRKAEGKWRDVRVYDASDLEQWIEQSIAGQIWFANETKHYSKDTRSLDQCWNDWANVAIPPLTTTLFEGQVESSIKNVVSRLTQEPDKPITIAADSTEEALAFLSVLFNASDPKLNEFRDRVAVFDKPDVLPQLASGASRFIAVALTQEVERELAHYCTSIHSIIIYPRNAINIEPDILLEPLTTEAFRIALESMAFNHDKIDRLENESGRSLTVLRRRLAIVDGIRKPSWAADYEIAKRLIPFMLAGSWDSLNLSDQKILSGLAHNKSYSNLEMDFQQLMQYNDAPVWSVDKYRGVVSKIDSLYAISCFVTKADIENYFDIAKKVLSEDDPALDLSESLRVFAPIYGKTRDISATLRKGICESLVLLAVHGTSLFQKKTGIDIEYQVTLFIRDVLDKELTVRVLEANDRDLPIYAEAAPDEFLSILERDLKTNHPASLSLMRPINSNFFSGCPRSGLLWALEGLAWSRRYLPRVILILARLAEIKIEDNWSNKPIASLKAIFRSWMPQTAVNLEERIKAMELLFRRFPKVAWDVCMSQFDHTNQIGSYSHKPRWRNDAYGYGEPVKNRENYSFVIKMADMALSQPEYDKEMIGDLIGRLYSLDDSRQEKVWTIILNWANNAADIEKAHLREKIRTTVLAPKGKAKSSYTLVQAANEVYNILEPANILNKYEWLFRDEWVQESYEELHDEKFDYERRSEKIINLRAGALSDITAQLGVEGVFEFAHMGNTALQIGMIMASKVILEADLVKFILFAWERSEQTNSQVYCDIITGTLRVIREDSQRTADLLKKLYEQLSSDSFVKVLAFAPVRSATWALLEGMDESYRQIYWKGVSPSREGQKDEELNTLVSRLIDVDRPRTAFQCADIKLEQLRPSVLYRLLEALVMNDNELEIGRWPDSYYIEEAFKLLNSSEAFSIEEMAGLEIYYLDVLAEFRWNPNKSSIPNLEKYIELHPEFFAQVIAWIYKRDDLKEDPESLRLSNTQDRHGRAKKGYQLLESLRQIPGRNRQGEIDQHLLFDWISRVRENCAELGRQEVGDISLGKLMAEAPKGNDGIWPCEPLREVLESIQSEKISAGITTGLFNSRGTYSAGHRGEKERSWAGMYRSWQEELEYSYPFVAKTILKRMAESYESTARYEDTAADIRRRLR